MPAPAPGPASGRSREQEAPAAPGSCTGRARRLLLAPLAALAVLVGYVIWQPWPRPAFFGSEAGISNAYVGNTYVCGDAVARGDAGPWPVEVLEMSLVPQVSQEVRAVLFAASPSSRYYDVGTGVDARWPDLGDPELRTSGFTLEPVRPGLRPYRVLLALEPAERGTFGRFRATITYRYRWLPARSATVDLACVVEVTATGRDPRSGSDG